MANSQSTGRRRVASLLLAATLTAACLGTSSATFAVTRRVPSEIPEIQAALDSSASGDTVLVAPGEYSWASGPLTFRGKNLILRSEAGPEATVLRGRPGAGAIVFANYEWRTARVEGFTIRVGDLGGQAAVHVSRSQPTISDCVIVGNQSGSFTSGIVALEGGFPLISNTVIAFNSGGVFGSAITVVGDGCAEIVGCTIYGNSSGSASCPEGKGQVWVGTSGCQLSLLRTIIAASPDLPAVACGVCDQVVLSCCDVHGNACGDYVGAGCLDGWNGAAGNFSGDPRFCNPSPEALDFSLASDSPCLPGNHPGGVPCGVIGARAEGCPPTTATSPTSWGAIKGLYQ